jgi:hypothetical protein
MIWNKSSNYNNMHGATIKNALNLFLDCLIHEDEGSMFLPSKRWTPRTQRHSVTSHKT